MVGPRRAPYLKSGTHILQWWNLAQLILPKEDPKSIWIKSIISVHDVTNKIVSRDLSYNIYIWSGDQRFVALAFLWEKLWKPQFYKDLTKILTRFDHFFDEWSWFKFNKLGLAVCMVLKFCTWVAKGSKLKVRKF